ncbi:hypothetical protein [Amycolatopsis circi]|nr:hypothetical protein [Amycolatopsis circi]
MAVEQPTSPRTSLALVLGRMPAALVGKPADEPGMVEEFIGAWGG